MTLFDLTDKQIERLYWRLRDRAHDKMGGAFDWPTLWVCYPGLYHDINRVAVYARARYFRQGGGI